MRENLGLVLGVLVVMQDGLHLCLETPEGLREGDFVIVTDDKAEVAIHLMDDKGSLKTTIAEKLLEGKEVYLKLLAQTKGKEKRLDIH